MRRYLWALAPVFLVACGGGGSSSPTTSTGEPTYELRVIGGDPQNLLYGHQYEVQLWTTDGLHVPAGGARLPLDSEVKVSERASATEAITSVYCLSQTASATLRGIVRKDGIESPVSANLPVRFVKGQTFRLDISTDADGAPVEGIDIGVRLTPVPFALDGQSSLVYPTTPTGASGAKSYILPLNASSLSVPVYGTPHKTYSRVRVLGVVHDLPAQVSIPAQAGGATLEMRLEYLE